MEKVVVRPEASKLIESMRDIGYSLDTALADVIDNSISAGATTIEILALTTGADPCIAILDDGYGMTREELLSAMRPGSRNPLEMRGTHDLGRFGLGLKTASFSQCRRLSVTSVKNGTTVSAIWDLDHVAQCNEWEVLIPTDLESIPFADRLGKTGTLVVWEKLDRLIAVKSERQDQMSIPRQVDEAREHLELVFHRFLSKEPGERSVRMLLNGRPLEAFDPFNSGHPATQPDPQYPDLLKLRNYEIKVQAFTLPHHQKVSKVEWDRYAGKAGYTKNQGFYVYRERRLIVYGTWFGLARQTELTKLSRVRIDTPRELDAEWKIDVKKASAQPPSEIREYLRRLIERIGATSKRVYTYRGRVLAADSRLPVWSRTQNKGEITYRINLEHPMMASVIGHLTPDSVREFRHAMEMAAAALPLDALLADLSGRPEEVEGPAMTGEALSAVAVTTYRTLNSDGDEKDDSVISMMSAVEPFRSRWTEVLSYLTDFFGWNTDERDSQKA